MQPTLFGDWHLEILSSVKLKWSEIRNAVSDSPGFPPKCMCVLIAQSLYRCSQMLGWSRSDSACVWATRDVTWLTQRQDSNPPFFFYSRYSIQKDERTAYIGRWCERELTSGGGSTESQDLSKSTNIQINIYFSKSSNTMTTILK